LKKLIIIFALSGCSQLDVIQTKKYVVVSVFNETVLETDDKSKAYEVAHNLTLMGRIFSSKPVYFDEEKSEIFFLTIPQQVVKYLHEQKN